MVCTFFGHHDCPSSIKPLLKETIKEQIGEGITDFYVGNNGNFDRMAIDCLRELKQEYPELRFVVVLAYLPAKNDLGKPSETMYPEGMESVPKRFAIDYRNRWILRRSDVIITYVTRPWGGATKFAEIAEKQGKKILRLKT